jgi:chromosome segregation and condensation protein ScpB
MSYKHRRYKKLLEYKVRLDEQENAESEIALELTGGQRAVITRQLYVEYCRNVIRNARNSLGRAAFGIVNPDGDIKYRFA